MENLSRTGLSLYETMELPKTSTNEEIKAKYRQLALKYHPDKNLNDPEATKKFIEINHAYSVLSDPKKREIYDKHGSLGLYISERLGNDFLVAKKPWVICLALCLCLVTCCCCCLCCCCCCGRGLHQDLGGEDMQFHNTKASDECGKCCLKDTIEPDLEEKQPLPRNRTTVHRLEEKTQVYAIRRVPMTPAQILSCSRKKECNTFSKQKINASPELERRYSTEIIKKTFSNKSSQTDLYLGRKMSLDLNRHIRSEEKLRLSPQIRKKTTKETRKGFSEHQRQVSSKDSKISKKDHNSKNNT